MNLVIIPMIVKVRAHPFIRRFLDDHPEVDVEIEAETTTVAECLKKLTDQYPLLKEQILKDNKLRNYIELYVNNESAYPDEMGKILKDGDILTIIAYIAGG